MRELEATGYLVRERSRVRGQFTYAKVVYDEPEHWNPIQPDPSETGDEIFGVRLHAVPSG